MCTRLQMHMPLKAYDSDSPLAAPSGGTVVDDVHGHTYRRIVELCDDAKDGFESSPIHDAVLSLNNLTLDQALRHEPTLLNRRDGTGFTPLHWAVLRDDIDAISTLIAWKADVDCRDIEGNTPLHIACRSTRPSAVRLLLSAKCSISLPNDFGSTPLYMAAESLLPDSDIIVEMLLESGASPDDGGYFGHPLHIFMRQIFAYRDLSRAAHMIRKLELLVRAGTDINSRDDRLRAPAHWACRVAWACPYFGILRDAGADLSVVDANGQSILHWVARYGCAAIVDDMHMATPEAMSGLDPFRGDKSGRTPLELLTWARGATDTELEMQGAVRPTDSMICSMLLLLLDLPVVRDPSEFHKQMPSLILAAVRHGNAALFRALYARSLPVDILEVVDEQGRTLAEVMAWRRSVGEGLLLGVRKPTQEEEEAFLALMDVVMKGRDSVDGETEDEFFDAEN
ncbi:ankyrin repeat-containing domain protein [Podospora aff. communis PSN243]|uniref:Ankyrin repeat-containing domain protein n=1 Tax=Podospora aff. communis PSN243 TaxID=3040156 RepID=A0AAV9GC97_9PEZI|nr:ankyrin repeat-containing domain protein [Podospora aff. communis PSN243]